MIEKPDTPTASFRRYAQAFQSLSPKAVAEHFNEPAIMITPRGISAFTTAADVAQAYGRLMAELPGLSYSRTEFFEITERRLSDDLALVTGSGVWKTASGDDLPHSHFGMSYTLRRAGNTWRIVVAAIHDPDSVR